MPLPPSSIQAGAGATILAQPLGQQRDDRQEPVSDRAGGGAIRPVHRGLRLRRRGPSESTTDLVFGGHCLIAENGRLLAESPRVGDGQTIRRDSYWITHDVDVAKLQSDRRDPTSFEQGPRFSQTVSADRIRAGSGRWPA